MACKPKGVRTQRCAAFFPPSHALLAECIQSKKIPFYQVHFHHSSFFIVHCELCIMNYELTPPRIPV